MPTQRDRGAKNDPSAPGKRQSRATVNGSSRPKNGLEGEGNTATLTPLPTSHRGYNREISAKSRLMFTCFREDFRWPERWRCDKPGFVENARGPSMRRASKVARRYIRRAGRGNSEYSRYVLMRCVYRARLVRRGNHILLRLAFCVVPAEAGTSGLKISGSCGGRNDG